MENQQVSHWTWPFIVDLHTKMVIFHGHLRLPEGISDAYIVIYMCDIVWHCVTLRFLCMCPLCPSRHAPLCLVTNAISADFFRRQTKFASPLVSSESNHFPGSNFIKTQSFSHQVIASCQLDRLDHTFVQQDGAMREGCACSSCTSEDTTVSRHQPNERFWR